MLPLLAAGLIGAGAGSFLGAANNRKKEKAFRDQSNQAAQKSAWSGIIGGPMGDVILERPSFLADTGEGAAKGALAGVGVYGDLQKSLRPDTSVVIGNNTIGAPTTPGLIGSTPSLAPSQESMNEINNNIYSGWNGLGSPGTSSVQSARKSFGYGNRMPASSINTVPQMRPWNQYGGTGGR